jgi:trehalose/maltose hydrolase-like predicted phosphorylase
VARAPAATQRPARGVPRSLDRRFEAVVFDWDGTAVTDRGADAAELCTLVEELCAHGLDLAVVTGTHVANVDGQLGARPVGPGRLVLCVNRGSEVFEATGRGLRLIERRSATAAEDAALDAAAHATATELRRRGLEVDVVANRLNRRKIDLIPDWREPPKAVLAELLAAVEDRLHCGGVAGLADAVAIALDAAAAAGLPKARVTSDAKHLEIGLTDKADAAQWVFRDLACRGIGPGLVLVAGDEFGPLGGLPGSDAVLLVPEAGRATAVSFGAEPTGTPPGVVALGGGPEAFRRLLADQLARRHRGDVPDVDDDPNWTLTVEGVDRRFERVHESLLTLADGCTGTRGTALATNGSATPGVVVSGVYVGDGPATRLGRCPDWTRHGIRPRRRRSMLRRLDLRTGVLREDGSVTAARFASLAVPGTVALRARATGDLPRLSGVHRTPGAASAVLVDSVRDSSFERVGAYDVDPNAALAAALAAGDAGFEQLLREQRAAWARRWAEADVVVDGDPELQRAVRFALFHLMASVADRGEAGVGARGLSGPAYSGHVFWDSDVFVLPFLAATHPAAARSMLEYRVRRLPAARAAARTLGRDGARFAWESAATGVDVTPTSARLATGELVAILTGQLEEHIVADVAWAASCYLDWTGDAAFAAAPGAELLVETARYWASRVRFDRDGTVHIDGVIGPDEYHEGVDDNAFTNVIARWNLRRAAAVPGVDESERWKWLSIADALVDGFDRATGVYEQFAGFFGLEPLVIAEIVPRRPIAADLLLGAERTRAAQVLKQADVLMLHHLLPDEVPPASLVPNLDFYEPRTAHGSSLSPAIHAGLLARAGRFDDALAALSIAARIDLDDLTGTTAGGLHLATMGGLWQALVFGFAGVRPRGDRLVVEPHLPPAWNALEIALRFRGEPLRLRLDHDGVGVDSPFWTVRESDTNWEVLAR